MKTRTRLLILMFATFTSAAALAAAAPGEQLINGNFDATPFFTGWQIHNADIVGAPWVNTSAPYAVDMNTTGTNAAGDLAQTFSTWPGFDYFVSYDLSANASGCSANTKTLTVNVDSYSATQQVVVATEGIQPAYQHETFTFTATGNSATLEFKGDNTGSCGPMIDTVSVIGPIVDIDGQHDATPYQSGNGALRDPASSLLTLNFPAGTFKLVPISARFIAWTQWSGNMGWEDDYLISSSQIGSLTVGDGGQYDTPVHALNNAISNVIPYTLNQSSAGQVSFGVTDPWSLGDNAGGVSLLVEKVDGPPAVTCTDVSANTYPGMCTVSTNIGTASDPDGDNDITTTQSQTDFGLGTTNATFTATDTSTGLQSSCTANVTVTDAEAPTVLCNVPANTSLSGSDLPISYTATAGDNCSIKQVTVAFDGCTMDKNGKPTGCDVTTNGATVTISDLGKGKTAHWTATAVDGSGNTTSADCSVDRGASNQGLGNGSEGSDPGNSDQGNPANSNDENGGTPGHPGKRKK